MPYKSAKQRAYMHIHHPKIAARWDEKYGGKIESDDEAEVVNDRIRKKRASRGKEKKN